MVLFYGGISTVSGDIFVLIRYYRPHLFFFSESFPQPTKLDDDDDDDCTFHSREHIKVQYILKESTRRELSK